MALKDIFTVNRKTFFNPSAWLDFETMRGQTKYLWSALRNFFTPETATREETFEQAVERLELSEQDIKSTISRYRGYALLFAVFGLLVLFYSFYLLFSSGAFLDWLIGLAIVVLFASQAFRFDFYAFQMKSRKLGLTFSDWKKHVLGEKDAHK